MSEPAVNQQRQGVQGPAADAAEFQAVAHRKGDDVAVAVEDLTPGSSVRVHFLDGSDGLEVRIAEIVVLGHKFALRDIQSGEKVAEYGEVIGKAVAPIARGRHVHTHNLKSLRWSRS